MPGWPGDLARRISIAEFDPTGRFVGLKGLTVDITERKQSDERQSLLIAELDHRVKNSTGKSGGHQQLYASRQQLGG